MDGDLTWWHYLIGFIALILLWRFVFIFSVLIAAIVGIAYAVFFHTGPIEWRLAASVLIFIVARALMNWADDDAGKSSALRPRGGGHRGTYGMPKRKPCPTCGGGRRVYCSHIGHDPHYSRVCSDCNGSGYKLCMTCFGAGDVPE